jgi:hypothetical protein
MHLEAWPESWYRKAGLSSTYGLVPVGMHHRIQGFRKMGFDRRVYVCAKFSGATLNLSVGGHVDLSLSVQVTRVGWTTSRLPRCGTAARPSSASSRALFSPTPPGTSSPRPTGRRWTMRTRTLAAAGPCWWTCRRRYRSSWQWPWARTGWCTWRTGTTWGVSGGTSSKPRSARQLGKGESNTGRPHEASIGAAVCRERSLS